MEVDISSNSSNMSGKPLYTLINNLVQVSNNDSSTMVENSQLLDILRLEFNMEIHSQSDLNVDIYMNVLKKFLRTWPRWDEFDKVMKDNNDNPEVQQKLTLEEYKKLKEYLQRILDFTHTQMKPIMDKMEQRRAKAKADKDKVPPTNNGELVMEVSCTREQLNQLFYRKPHPQTLTIFNITDEPTSSKISVNDIKFKEILNWPNINVSITLPNFEFTRRNSSYFDRTLINRKIGDIKSITSLPSDLYVSTSVHARKKYINKNVLMSYVVSLINYIKKWSMRNEERRTHIINIFDEIKNDLLLLSDNMFIGCEYQFFLCNYPYVRYLSSSEYPEVKVPRNETIDKLKECINPNDFELYLEEEISPAVKIELSKFSVVYTEDKSGRKFNIDNCGFLDAKNNWLHFECTWCDYKCDGFLGMYNIVLHLNTYHWAEHDWHCTNCKNSFSTQSLCANRWSHKC